MWLISISIRNLSDEWLQNSFQKRLFCELLWRKNALIIMKKIL